MTLYIIIRLETNLHIVDYNCKNVVGLRTQMIKFELHCFVVNIGWFRTCFFFVCFVFCTVDKKNISEDKITMHATERKYVHRKITLQNAPWGIQLPSKNAKLWTKNQSLIRVPRVSDSNKFLKFISMLNINETKTRISISIKHLWGRKPFCTD